MYARAAVYSIIARRSLGDVKATHRAAGDECGDVDVTTDA